MRLRALHGLILALAATLLLVSADGGVLRTPAQASTAARDAERPAARAAEDAALPARQPEPEQTRSPQAAGLDEEVGRIRRDRLACTAEGGAPADLFAGKSWYVPPPPPPPPKPSPPPPPTAPPLPFAFLGSYQEPDGRQIYFLTRGERLYTVSAGDVIDGTYRVEEASGGQLGLTYLPLNILQSMNVGEAS